MVLKISTNIASALGDGWHVSEYYDHYSELKAPGYQLLKINFYDKKIRAVLPRNARNSIDTYAAMGCNLQRPPKDLARDIKRRLLGGFKESCEETRRARCEALKSVKHTDYVIESVRRFYPLEDDHFKRWYSFKPFSAVECMLTRMGNGGYSLQINCLTGDQLVKLVALLKGMENDQ